MSSLKNILQTIDLMNAGGIIIKNGRVSDLNAVARELIEKENFIKLENEAIDLVEGTNELKLALQQTGRHGANCEFYKAHHDKHGGYLVQVRCEAPDLQLICIFQLGHSNGVEDAVFSAFSDLFDLSQAERRVVLSVLEGIEISAYAKNAGVQTDTARKQLKSAQGKLRMRDQKQLLRAYMQYAAARQYIVTL